MVNDAEKYKDEDRKQQERVTARNALENYLFSVKQAAEGAGDKISAADKEKVTKQCEDVLKWLDMNNSAEKEEFEFKMKETQDVCSPIMSKLHSGGQKE